MLNQSQKKQWSTMLGLLGALQATLSWEGSAKGHLWDLDCKVKAVAAAVQLKHVPCMSKASTALIVPPGSSPCLW